MTQKAKKRKTSEQNTTFSPVLARSLNALRDRIAQNKASMALVDGQIGLGKTTLAVEMANYYQGSPINLSHQLAMGAEEFAKKLLYCVDNNLKVLIYDESGDFDKRSSLSRVNKMLNRIFDTFRTYKILIIMVLPNLMVLDAQLFLKAIPRFLVHIETRDSKKGTFSIYSLSGMMHLKVKMSHLVVPFDAYRYVYTDFRGVFYNLDKNAAAELDRISTENKKKILDEFVQAFNQPEQKQIEVNELDRDIIQAEVKKSVDLFSKEEDLK